MDIQQLLKKIDTKRNEINTLRPINPTFLSKIKQKMNISYTYHSNHLEGNSLTYQETWSFLETGLIQSSDKNKKYQDYKEIEGHNKVVKKLGLIDKLEYTEDIIKKENLDITENLIRELHQMILVEDHKIPRRDENGEVYWVDIKVGQYKTKDNHVTRKDGKLFKFVETNEVKSKMYDLLNWFNQNKNNHHPLVVASMFHYKFIRIHPFDDGNGRMSRLLMNMILMYNGFPIIIIPSDEKGKEEYYQSLEISDSFFPNIDDTIQTNDETLFENFTTYLGNKLLDSMEWVIRGAKGEDILDSDDELKQFTLEMKLKNEKNNLEITREWIKDKKNKDIFFENILYPIINSINKFGESIEQFYQEISLELWYPNMTPYKKQIPQEISISQYYKEKFKPLLDNVDISTMEAKVDTHRYIHHYGIKLKKLKNVGKDRDDNITCECIFHQGQIEIRIGISSNHRQYTKKYGDVSPIEEEKDIIKKLIQRYKILTQNLYV